MEVKVYSVPLEKLGRLIDTMESYGIVNVDVENAASIFDDMTKSDAERLRYARRILSEGNVDKAVLVVRGERGVLVIKMENVVEVRVDLKDYRRIIEDFALKQG